ncbi:MAG: ABC transporter ATP-binding protein [Bacillus sp. (in: firmicutes)]
MKIEVRGGNFSYQKVKRNQTPAFLYHNDIHFELDSGEILAILGPNGAGKTTLLKCIMGLLKWNVGETYMNETPLSAMPEKKIWENIGYVPQASKMTFAYSILDLVTMGRALYIRAYSQPKAEDKAAAYAALEAVGIAHLAEKSCNAVSGGELQLALIARTLVANPKILILDEPESHLDIQKQIVILKTLKRLAKERGISCIINTHYPNHAFYLADRVLMTAKGKRVVYGDVREIMTEARMKEYFGIELKKIIYEEDDYLIETMVPQDLGVERDISTCRYNTF